MQVSLQRALKILTAQYGPMIELEEKKRTCSGQVVVHFVSRYEGFKAIRHRSVAADNWKSMLLKLVPGYLSTCEPTSYYFSERYCNDLYRKRKAKAVIQTDSRGSVSENNDKCGGSGITLQDIQN